MTNIISITSAQQNQDLSDILPVQKQSFGDEEINAVDARKLHEFLESKQEFANWVKNRIQEYEFVEDQDYGVFDIPVKNHSGGRPRKDYVISIDMAKELCMVEKNNKGKQARRYFIEIQRKAETILKELEVVEYKGDIDGLVYANKGKPITNSRVVAKVFEKEHKHVLRDIREKMLELQSTEKGKAFNESNFGRNTYMDKKGELRDSFDMTEQGFSFIVLGYTGSKATSFKIDFINAFFAMKNALMNRVKSEILKDVLPKTNGKRNFVYVLGNEDNAYLKIGVSTDVDKRVKQLQTGSWSKLFVLYKSMVCSNSFDIETSVHNKIQDKNVIGEWFDIDLAEAINLIESENFVLNSSYLKDYYENNESSLFKIA